MNRIPIFVVVASVFGILSGSGSEENAILLDLDTALRMAAESNLTVRQGALDPRAAEENVRGSAGVFDPALELSYNRAEDTNAQPLDPIGGRPPAAEILSDDYEAGFRGFLPTGATYRAGFSSQNRRGTFNDFVDSYYSFLGVTVSQPLLRNAGSGAALANLRVARSQSESAEWAYRQLVYDTLTFTALAYHDLVRARETYRVAERSLELAMQLVSDNRKREQRGAMSVQDVVEAEARAARRRDAMIGTKRTVLNAENRLRRLIYDDFSSAPSGEIQTYSVTQTAPDVEILREIAGKALENRPDYRQAVLSLDQRRIEFGLERSRALPAVDLVASYGFSGVDDTFGNSVDQIWDAENDSYSIGAVVSVPLPNRTRTARRRVAELEIQRAELLLYDLEQEILRQLDDSIRGIEIAVERVAASRHTRELQEKSLEAEEKRLRVGSSSTFLVLEQQRQLGDSELRELTAVADLAASLAEFYRLTGHTVTAFGLDPSVLDYTQKE